MLLSGSRLPASGQAVDSDVAGWEAQETWQRAYRACFDTHGRPTPEKLRSLAADIEARRSVFGNSLPVSEQLVLLHTLVRARCNLHDWRSAEAADRSLLRTAAEQGDTDVSAETSRTTAWYRTEAYRDLAGIRAMQGRTDLATRSYLQWLLLWINRHCTAHAIVAYGLLALWWLKGCTNPTARAPKQAWIRLALAAAIPLLFVLIDCVSELCASGALCGNAFASTVLEWDHSRVSPVVTTVWVVVLLGCSVPLRLRLSRQGRRAAQERSNEDAGSGAVVAPSRLCLRIALLLSVTLLGWVLQHYGPDLLYAGRIARLPANLAWWRHSGHANANWVYETALRVTVASWVEEFFFRGVLYDYARRKFGFGFALVFSSVVFASWHGAPEHAMFYVWIGMVFAVQYEVCGSLIPSTATHCFHNLLTYLAARP